MTNNHKLQRCHTENTECLSVSISKHPTVILRAVEGSLNAKNATQNLIFFGVYVNIYYMQIFLFANSLGETC